MNLIAKIVVFVMSKMKGEGFALKYEPCKWKGNPSNNIKPQLEQLILSDKKCPGGSSLNLFFQATLSRRTNSVRLVLFYWPQNHKGNKTCNGRGYVACYVYMEVAS